MKKIIIVAAMLLNTPCLAQVSQTPKPDDQKKPAIPAQTSEAKQTEVTAEGPPFSSLPRRPLPQITLQRALKSAESYLKQQHVQLSKLCLVEAKYEVLDTGDEQVQWWIFRWESKNRQGNDKELYVSMKGLVWDPPSM